MVVIPSLPTCIVTDCDKVAHPIGGMKRNPALAVILRPNDITEGFADMTSRHPPLLPTVYYS